MSVSSRCIVSALAGAALAIAAPGHAAMTPDQARAKLVAAFECQDKRDGTDDIPALAQAVGGKRTKHEVNEVGDYNTTYTLSKPITLFGQPVSKLLIWQNAGDGGDASFGLNAYYSASLDTMIKAAGTQRQKVDDQWLNIRKIDKRTSLIVDVRDGRTMTFCETTIIAGDD